MRYFKSLNPDIAIYCANGTAIKWKHYDYKEGWFITEDPVEIAALENCIKKKIGGAISEGTEKELEEWQKKTQGAPQPRPEREVVEPFRPAPPTVTPSSTTSTGSSHAEAPVVEVEPSEEPRLVKRPPPKK